MTMPPACLHAAAAEQIAGSDTCAPPRTATVPQPGPAKKQACAVTFMHLMLVAGCNFIVDAQAMIAKAKWKKNQSKRIMDRRLRKQA